MKYSYQDNLLKIGRRGSPWASKEDATTWKWSRSNSRKINERKPEARGEGKGPAKCEWYYIYDDN